MIKVGDRVIATRDTIFYRERDRGTVVEVVEELEEVVGEIGYRAQFDRVAPCGRSRPMWAIRPSDIAKSSPSYLWRFLFEGVW